MEKYTSQQPKTVKSVLANFWFYHKWHLLVGFMVVCMLFVGVNSCIHRQSVDMYVLYMITGSYTTKSNEELALKLEKYVDDIDGDGEKRVQIITISFSDVLARTDQSQEATLARFVGQVATGPALFYIFDEENYNALKNAEVQVLGEIGDVGEDSRCLEGDRYNASEAGFFDGVAGFSDKDEALYFGMRVSENIPEDDSRYAQIAQCQQVLSRIVEEYK